MKLIVISALIFLVASCYGINEKTSGISSINYSCPDSQWDSILKDYSVDRITDSSFSKKISSFRTQPFATKLIYFDQEPKEIIGVSKNYYQIRYVYNPELSSEVLNGFSKKLTPDEVERISKRIYTLLEEYGCKENR